MMIIIIAMMMIDDDDDDDDDNIWVLSMYVCVYRYKYVCVHYQFLSPY